MSDKHRNPVMGVLKSMLEGASIIGNAMSSFVLVPKIYSLEEMQDKINLDLPEGVTLDWNGQHSDKENLAKDWQKVGDDMSIATKKAIEKLENR